MSGGAAFRRTGFAIMALMAAAGLASEARAQEPALARVALLQPPVWVQRGGQQSALHAGETLQAGDQLVTGSGGRLHVATGDGSTVKLGSDAQLAVPELAVADEGGQSGVFKASLQVLKGAFRFTTRALDKLRPRAVSVQIGPTITAGIRGTDIWGKSDSDQALLCLIEGHIVVQSPGAGQQDMAQAQTFYVVPSGQPPLPIAPVPGEKLASWARQTEMDPAQPALSANGGWRLVFLSTTKVDDAWAQQRALDGKGYGADVLTVKLGSQTRYRLALSGYASAKDAARAAANAQAQLHLPERPWVLGPSG